MEIEERFTTAAQAVAVVEAALGFLARDENRKGTAADRLELIGRLRTAAGRAASLVSVWVAEADRSKVAQEAAGTTVTDWLSRAGNADRKEAAGILNQGRALLETPALKNAATAGARRLCCDAEIIPAVLGSNPAILDMGEAAGVAQQQQRDSAPRRGGGEL